MGTGSSVVGAPEGHPRSVACAAVPPPGEAGRDSKTVTEQQRTERAHCSLLTPVAQSSPLPFLRHQCEECTVGVSCTLR